MIFMGHSPGRKRQRVFGITTSRKKVTAQKPIRKNRRIELRNPTSEALEDRCLLATGAFLDPGTKQLMIYGSNGNDNVSLGYGTKIDSTGKSVTDIATTRVSIQIPDGSYINQDFPTANVANMRFVGNGGNDLIQNKSSLAYSTAPQSNNGTVSHSLLTGSALNNLNAQADQIGVFTVDQTGTVNVDYIYRGSGYNGSIGFYALDGMNAYTAGSVDYVAEAVRRVVSNSSKGFSAIDVNSEAARFSGPTPWESSSNNISNRYAGVKSFANFAPGTKFGAILIPNGTFNSINGKMIASINSGNRSNIDLILNSQERPLFSIPLANAWSNSSQLWGQMADLNSRGSLFAFEDARINGNSDKDYNDVIFQITGATGIAPPVSEITNPAKQFQKHEIYLNQIATYAITQQGKGSSLNENVQVAKGVWTADSTGQVSIDYRYDGGGYQGEMAIFSLNGMQSLTPGSSEYIKEAARRSLSDSTLGHIVIRDKVEGAAVSGAMTWESNFNNGAYAGVKSFSMLPGDKFAAMLVPNGSVWQAFINPSAGVSVTSKETKLRPLFSVPSANPASTWGGAQLIDMMANNTAGVNFGWEDIRGDDVANCDRDFNDVVFKLTGALVNATDTWTNVPVPTNKKFMKSTLVSSIFI